MTSPQIERVDAIPILITWLRSTSIATGRPIGNGMGSATANLPCCS